MKRLLQLMAFGVLLTACSKPEKLTFSTCAAARSAGTVEKGWLPGFLPDTAASLQIKKDSIRPLVACKLPPADFEVLRKSATAVPKDWKTQLGRGFHPGDFRPAADWTLLYVQGEGYPWYLAYDAGHESLVLWR